MKAFHLIICILITTASMNAQGFYIGRGSSAYSAGIGLNANNEFTGVAASAGVSILGKLDIGVAYLRAIKTNYGYSPEGSKLHLDFYAKKDSLYGIAINLGTGSINNGFTALFGITGYGRFVQLSGAPVSLYPNLGISYRTNESIGISLGFGVEFLVADHFSIVFTPGGAVSVSTYGKNNDPVGQFSVELELVYK